MSASILFIQLDQLPPELIVRQGASLNNLVAALRLSPGDIQLYCVSSNKPLPCTKNRPVIIVGGLWNNADHPRLPSRLFQWLQRASHDACPIFGFGFAHLVLNSVFGGVNLEPQKPGLKTVYKSTSDKDFLTASLPDRFSSWTICTMKSTPPPYVAKVLAESHRQEPMLIRFNERTYSTPLSLSLSWSGIVMWLHEHPDWLYGNEQILDARMDNTHGLSILANFLKLWRHYPCRPLISGSQASEIHQPFHQC